MDTPTEPAPAVKPKAKRPKPKKTVKRKPAKTKRPAKPKARKPAKRKAAKRKPGRKASNIVRSERLDMRLTKAEKAKVMAKAKKTRRTVTSLIIEAIEKIR